MPNGTVSLGRAVDAVIVGAGPAGAAMAIRLAERGLRPLLIDRARFPREKACSEFLGPETARQLSELGVLPGVASAGMPLLGATIVGPAGATVRGRFPGPGQGWSIPRAILDQLLVERAQAAGAVLMEDAHLEDLTRDGRTVTGVIVRQSRGTVAIGARLVVGCDGLNSTIAARLGGRRLEPLRRFGLVAHVAGVSHLGTSAEMHVGRDGYVGVNLIGNDLANVAVVIPERRLRAEGLSPLSLWEKVIQSFPLLCDRIQTSAIVRPVMAVGPFGRWSRRVVDDGAILVGDAADFFDPFTGDGICTALKGAGLAAPLVVAALENERVPRARDLAPYLAARRRTFAGKWIVERMIGYAMLAPRVFNRAVDRLNRRGLGDTLLGVTSAVVPAREVLNPGFLSAMMR